MMSKACESRSSELSPVVKGRGPVHWLALLCGALLSFLTLAAGIWVLQDYLDGHQPDTAAEDMSNTSKHANPSSKLVFHPMLGLLNNSGLTTSSSSFSALMFAARQFSTRPDVSLGTLPMHEVMAVVGKMNHSRNQTPVSVPISSSLCAADGVTCIALNQTAHLIDFNEFESGEIEVRATIGKWDDMIFQATCSPAEDSDCQLELQGNGDSEEVDDAERDPSRQLEVLSDSDSHEDDDAAPRLLWGRRRRRRRSPRCCPHGSCGHKDLYRDFENRGWCSRKCYATKNPDPSSCGAGKNICCKHKIVIIISFPSSSKVQLADGTSRQIAALKHGDQVSVLDDAGNVRHESFLVDLHKRTVEIAEYLELVHHWGAIRISANHLIYASGKMRPAKDVNVGDEIVWLPGQQKSPVVSTITQIRTVMDVGYHAPLTFSGNLFVDGVLVSCYALVHPPGINAYMQHSRILKPVIDNAHAVIHFLMYPLRLGYCLKVHLAICRIVPSICSDELVYGTEMNLHMYARLVKQSFDVVFLTGIF